MHAEGKLPSVLVLILSLSHDAKRFPLRLKSHRARFKTVAKPVNGTAVVYGSWF